MLQTRIKAFGVLPNDDQIDVRIARRNMRQIAHRPEVGIKIELLSKLYVDAGKAPADRGCDRTLECDMRAFDRLGQRLGNVFFVFFVSFCASLNGLPLEGETCGFQYANNGLRNFCTDSVAGDEGDFMGHWVNESGRVKTCNYMGFAVFLTCGSIDSFVFRRSFNSAINS